MSRTPTDENRELRRELLAAAQALRLAYERFNYACEPELVESSVYEIKALQARYSYLLRAAKTAEEPAAAALAAEGGGPCRS